MFFLVNFRRSFFLENSSSISFSHENTYMHTCSCVYVFRVFHASFGTHRRHVSDEKQVFFWRNKRAKFNTIGKGLHNLCSACTYDSKSDLYRATPAVTQGLCSLSICRSYDKHMFVSGFALIHKICSKRTHSDL